MPGARPSDEMLGSIVGKVCVVTGAASGIGRATVERLSRDGAHVVGVDSNHVELAECGAEFCIRGDVTIEETVSGLLDAVVQRYGRIDAMVVNAGVSLGKRVDETSLDEWRRVIDVNLTGAFLCAKHAVRRMHNGGSLVFHASVSGVVATTGEAAYCASKAGVVGLARAVAVDHAAYGIRANCVCPGVVETPMVADLLGSLPIRGRLERRHPLRRLGLPREIAAVSRFLISDESSFMTGAVIAADGGYTAW